MVKYNCERCNLEFSKKCDYLNHINRKFKCLPLLENIDKTNLISKNFGWVTNKNWLKNY